MKISSKVRRLLLISLSSFTVAFFLYLSTEVREASQGHQELIGEFDSAAAKLAMSTRNGHLFPVAVVLTSLGSGRFLSGFLVLAALAFAWRRQTRSALLLIASGVGASILSFILKLYFERARPDALQHLVEADGFSYPSGHSLGASAIYLTTAILLSQHTQSKSGRIAFVLGGLLLSLGVGLSRIYLGVHYFSDVLAGMCLGISLASLLGAISRRSDEMERVVNVE